MLRGRQMQISADENWGIGAAGSAFEWHSKGRGFESHMLHGRESLKDTGIVTGFLRDFLFGNKYGETILWDGAVWREAEGTG